MTARANQETTITFMRDDEWVLVYTSNVVHLRRLKKMAENQDFVTEKWSDDEAGQFLVNAENFNVFSAIRAKRTTTPEQRKAASERMRKMREEANE